VEVELRAQVNRFCELVGHMPYHMDGHQHVHVLPGNGSNNPFHLTSTFNHLPDSFIQSDLQMRRAIEAIDLVQPSLAVT